MSPEKVFIDSFKTPIGTLTIAVVSDNLVGVALPNHKRAEFETRLRSKYSKLSVAKDNRTLKSAREQLTAYCEGSLTDFNLQYSLVGCTPFEQAVLETVYRIPYGATRSYGDIARAAGYPTAFRAVGTANARNPLPILIPCHRVVAANGLGGYGGGIALKKRLLTLEQANSPMLK